MTTPIDQVSLAIGELRAGLSALALGQQEANKQIKEVADKLDALTLREHEYRAAMKTGAKISYAIVAVVGGLVSHFIQWFFPNLGK